MGLASAASFNEFTPACLTYIQLQVTSWPLSAPQRQTGGSMQHAPVRKVQGPNIKCDVCRFSASSSTGKITSGKNYPAPPPPSAFDGKPWFLTRRGSTLLSTPVESPIMKSSSETPRPRVTYHRANVHRNTGFTGASSLAQKLKTEKKSLACAAMSKTIQSPVGHTKKPKLGT